MRSFVRNNQRVKAELLKKGAPKFSTENGALVHRAIIKKLRMRSVHAGSNTTIG